MVDLIDNKLRQFNGDVNTKQIVLDFIHDHINKKALERMYKKQSVEHISDAVQLIDSAFQQLEINYGIQQKQENITNHSR